MTRRPRLSVRSCAEEVRTTAKESCVGLRVNTVALYRSGLDDGHPLSALSHPGGRGDDAGFGGRHVVDFDLHGDGTFVLFGNRGIEGLGHGNVHEGRDGPAVHGTSRVEVPTLRPHPNDCAAFFRLEQLGPYQLPETTVFAHADMFPCGGPPETGVRADPAESASAFSCSPRPSLY